MKTILTLTALCVALLLVAAASVVACDPKLNMVHIPGIIEISDSPDTTRFYAKVDTCLTCPDDTERDYHVITVYEGMTSWNETIITCRGFDDNCARTMASPDTTLNTTWLPKVQVWMDSTQYKEWME